MKNRFVVLFPLVSMGCMVDAEPSIEPEAVGEREQPLFQESTTTKWPGGVVPVCYSAADGNNPSLLQQARGILDKTGWSAVANVQFTGWGPCDPSPTPNPRSFVQIHFKHGTRGFADTFGLKQPTFVSGVGYFPGITNLDLVDDDSSPRQDVFVYQVLHEFGHALGFAHEQSRPDNWPANSYCTDVDEDVELSGFLLTPYYDTDSVMNYCAGFTMELSRGDVAGVRAAYGSAVPIHPYMNAGFNAVARQPTKLDVATSVASGALRTSYWFLSSPQQPWATAALGTVAIPQSARIASVSRTQENIDTFYAMSNGAVGSSYWFQGASGYASTTVTATGLVASGQQLSALANTPGQINLFFASGVGRVYWTDWSFTRSSWETHAISGASTAPNNAAIAGVSRSVDKFDLFWIASSGAVRSAICSGSSCQPNTTSWSVVSTASLAACAAPTGAPLSVSARSTSNLDVFYVASSGAVCTTFWTPSTGWQTSQISPVGVAQAGARLASVARTANNLDVFFVDTAGALRTLYWSSTNPTWNLATLSGSLFAPGTAVSAVARTWDKLDVFMQSSANNLWTASWYNGAPSWTISQIN